MRLLLICLLATSCVHTNATLLGSRAYAPVPEHRVRIFLTESDVPGEFEKIALIHASASSGMTNEAKMLKELAKKAGELGANGVLLEEIIEPSSGAKIAGAIFGVSPQRKGSVVAIRYQEPSVDIAALERRLINAGKARIRYVGARSYSRADEQSRVVHVFDGVPVVEVLRVEKGWALIRVPDSGEGLILVTDLSPVEN